MMQKIYHLVLAVTIGAAVVLSSCNGNNPESKSLETKIIGKWKSVTQFGEETLTNERIIGTYEAGGKGYLSWRKFNKKPLTYTISDDYVTIKDETSVEYKQKVLSIDDNSMSSTVGDGVISADFNFKKVTVDYSRDILGMWERVAKSGDESYGDSIARMKYEEDGTYIYSLRDEQGNWQPLGDPISEWYVDGDWIFTRWQNQGVDTIEYEGWDIDYIRGNEMKWSALREREDGSHYTTTITWARVGENK